jgi:fumarate reductase subunit C
VTRAQYKFSWPNHWFARIRRFRHYLARNATVNTEFVRPMTFLIGIQAFMRTGRKGRLSFGASAKFGHASLMGYWGVAQ